MDRQGAKKPWRRRWAGVVAPTLATVALATVAFATVALAACSSSHMTGGAIVPTAGHADTSGDTSKIATVSPCGVCPDGMACNTASGACVLTPCAGICSDAEICNPKTQTCEAKNCGGDCLPGWECDALSNSCTTPCGGPCGAKTLCNHASLQCESVCGGGCPGEYCDPATTTCRLQCLPHCGSSQICRKHSCTTVALATKWGSDGASGNVQSVTRWKTAALANGCVFSADPTPRNAFAVLASILDAEWQSDIQNGWATLLVPGAIPQSGSPFQLALYSARRDPKNAQCDPSASSCNFLIDKASLDVAQCDLVSCPPLSLTENAKIAKGELSASLPPFTLVLLAGGLPLRLRVSALSVRGTVGGIGSWESTASGKLCGVVTQADFANAVAQLPGAATGDSLLGLLPTLVHPDVDTDGDGAADGRSLALEFSTVHALVSGYWEAQ